MMAMVGPAGRPAPGYGKLMRHCRTRPLGLDSSLSKFEHRCRCTQLLAVMYPDPQTRRQRKRADYRENEAAELRLGRQGVVSRQCPVVRRRCRVGLGMGYATSPSHLTFTLKRPLVLHVGRVGLGRLGQA